MGNNVGFHIPMGQSTNMHVEMSDLDYEQFITNKKTLACEYQYRTIYVAIKKYSQVLYQINPQA